MTYTGWKQIHAERKAEREAMTDNPYILAMREAIKDDPELTNVRVREGTLEDGHVMALMIGTKPYVHEGKRVVGSCAATGHPNDAPDLIAARVRNAIRVFKLNEGQSDATRAQPAEAATEPESGLSPTA